MPPLHIQNIILEFNIDLLHINSLSLPNMRVIEHFSYIACNSMIASNKQRQEGTIT
jgi:hypothetical protein